MSEHRPRGISIRWWILAANVVLLAVPLWALAALRLYDNYLVRQTERQLIAQGVVIAEAWRERWQAELGTPALADFRPPERAGDSFVPIEPVLDVRTGVLPPQASPLPPCEMADTPERRAAKALEPLLARSQVFNLSGVRILDARGCVLATSRSDDGADLSALPEVQKARAGTYGAIVRARLSDEPLPPLSDVRSRGSIRVFSALPVFAGGEVVAIVRLSRTSLDALTSLWHNRRGLVVWGAATLVVALLSTWALAILLTRPLQKLSRAAAAIAASEGGTGELPRTFGPRELNDLGDSLRIMTAALRQRGAYITELTTTISHELKTPITGIRGAAELLRDSDAGMSSEQRQRFLDNLDADARRLERLVARLIQLAKIESATPHDEPSLDTGAVLRDLVQPRAEQVRLVLTEPLPRVAMDPELFATAVGNLVDNALRYRRTAPVEVRVEAAGRHLRVDVTDDGPGIPDVNRDRVFERFFTTDRDRGGSGLGLAIVRAIATRRGGDVHYDSGPNGTRFTLVV